MEITNREIEFENTIGDLISFNLYHTPRSRPVQMVVVLFALLILRDSYTTGHSLLRNGLVFAQWLGLYFAFMLVYTVVSVAMSYKRSHNKTVFGSHKLKISDEGIFETTEFSTKNYSWKAVSKIVQNRRLIFIYVQSNMAFLVPKRIFKTHEELKEFERDAVSLWKSGNAIS